MNPPKLLARKRQHLGLLLALVAIAQAGFAAAFAAAISAMVGKPSLDIGLAMALATGFGGAILAERWIAERFAQSFVFDCRAAIFESVIRNRGEGQEARWLTSLVGDLTAIRYYAMRGSIRLWTSMLAGVAASGWLIGSVPSMAIALLPILCGFLIILALIFLLRREIAEQRQARGRLNRFVLRRVRLEMLAVPSPRGHGRLRLAELSGELVRRSERRAFIFGAMELIAAAAGGFATILLLVWQSKSAEAGTLVGQLSLIGFISTRLLETARALHARAGGGIALQRLAVLLAREPAAGRQHDAASETNID